MYLKDKVIDFAPEILPPTKTQHNLLAAAAYMRKHGWSRGKFQAFDGRVCIRGALNAVRYGEPIGFYSEAEEAAVAKFLGVDGSRRLFGESDGSRIAEWNNTVAGSAEEVIAVLEGAAHAA